jgi:uncharacterized protein (TIGR03083 family)
VRVEEHIERLASESDRFVSLARRADLEAPVPGCEGWVVRDVIGHVGQLLRWSQQLVATRRLEMTHWEAPDNAPPADGALLGWLIEACEQAVATFRAADLSEPVWSWAGDHRGWFWPRRMLFEVAGQATDLQRALGQEPSLDRDLVIEGIDEHLSNLPWTVLVHPQSPGPRGDMSTIALQATDGPRWRVLLLPGGMAWDRSDAPTDVTVTGPLLHLYLHALGRPNRCELSGDVDLYQRTLGSLTF